MNSLFFKGVLGTFFVAALSACRVTLPSFAEQQYLLNNDAFPAGPPPWMAAPLAATKGGGGGTLSTSLIPEYFGEDVGTIESAAYTPATRGSGVARGIMSRREASKPNLSPNRTETVEQASPLNRILAVCPTVESDVSKALQTIDIQARILQYESLTKRCPASDDLWLWLGRDYQKVGRLVEAGRSFERVLILDAGNEDAKAALATVRSRLENQQQ